MTRLKGLWERYRAVLLYLIFGGGTTLVNIVCYYLSYNLAGISNVASTILAWLLSVLFAYATNRRYVFHSAARGIQAVGREMLSFFGFRAATGALDVAIMFVAVDCMAWNGLLWKVLSNIIVIILNYVFSKWIIFKQKEKNP